LEQDPENRDVLYMLAVSYRHLNRIPMRSRRSNGSSVPTRGLADFIKSADIVRDLGRCEGD
jgi:hypothetical protein